MIGITIVCAVLLSAVNYCYMQKYDNNKRQGVTGIAQYTKPVTPHRMILSGIMLAGMIGCSVYFAYRNPSLSVTQLLKWLCCFSILWPAAVIDAREHIIPNKLLLIGVGYRLLILVVELFMGVDNVLVLVLSELAATLIIFVFSMLCRLIAKDSICMGDIKLMMCMGLMLGISYIMEALFMAFICCFFEASYLLIAKKKSRKDAIAFAPSVLAGMILTLLLIIIS